MVNFAFFVNKPRLEYTRLARKVQASKTYLQHFVFIFINRISGEYQSGGFPPALSRRIQSFPSGSVRFGDTHDDASDFGTYSNLYHPSGLYAVPVRTVGISLRIFLSSSSSPPHQLLRASSRTFTAARISCRLYYKSGHTRNGCGWKVPEFFKRLRLCFQLVTQFDDGVFAGAQAVNNL